MVGSRFGDQVGGGDGRLLGVVDGFGIGPTEGTGLGFVGRGDGTAVGKGVVLLVTFPSA